MSDRDGLRGQRRSPIARTSALRLVFVVVRTVDIAVTTVRGSHGGPGVGRPAHPLSAAVVLELSGQRVGARQRHLALDVGGGIAARRHVLSQLQFVGDDLRTVRDDAAVAIQVP